MAEKKAPKEEMQEIEFTAPSGQPFGMAIKMNENGIVITVRYGEGCEKINFFGIQPGQVTTMGGGQGCL